MYYIFKQNIRIWCIIIWNCCSWRWKGCHKVWHGSGKLLGPHPSHLFLYCQHPCPPPLTLFFTFTFTFIFSLFFKFNCTGTLSIPAHSLQWRIRFGSCILNRNWNLNFNFVLEHATCTLIEDLMMFKFFLLFYHMHSFKNILN